MNPALANAASATGAATVAGWFFCVFFFATAMSAVLQIWDEGDSSAHVAGL